MARSFPARLAFLLFGALVSAPVAAGLVPSQVNVGDCVADRISIAYSAERKPFDERYCRRWNSTDAAAFAVCLHNSSLNDTPFFTDRCGDGTEFFLAVNGVEHVLQRVGPKWIDVNLSGRFAGDGLELEVLPLKQWIEQATESNEEIAEGDDAESGSWVVRVTLRQGSESRTFEATLVYGP